jgi:SAM-dependent methyltransferase
MDSAVAARLLELNREFYTRFGGSFSATRQRIQPGVRRVLESLRGDENILDLGCGNGWFARELAKRGHRGTYLGVDFSLPLLREAEFHAEGFSARFMEADLGRLSVISEQLSVISDQLSVGSERLSAGSGQWSLVTAFAVLHHIPSRELRLEILRTVHSLLPPGGRFIHSNWQFLNSEKLRARIQPWEVVSISRSEVEAGDYLLDWRSGGRGLRYVHHFSEAELQSLAEEAGFEVREVFYSDGETGNLGLYEVWQAVRN